jgi:hypothetical protein
LFCQGGIGIIIVPLDRIGQEQNICIRHLLDVLPSRLWFCHLCDGGQVR